MNDEVLEVYDSLKKELTWLHGRWKIYRQLYGTSSDRIDLLNNSAPTFFYFTQQIMINDIQVSLGRLTDPARMGKSENLSLEQLQERIDKFHCGEFSHNARGLLDAVHEICDQFRALRNKKLAHLDLDHALERSANPIPYASREQVEKALLSMRTYMNHIEGYFYDSEYAYNLFVMSSDGNHLVWMLKSALRYRELVDEGVIPIDDLEKMKWKDA